MNASIRGMIDMLFKDTLETEEVRALHEEMINNCEEHYSDLLRQGLSETEALDAIVESLKGMKEVIDEYPKKEKAQELQKTIQGQERATETARENEDVFDRDQVFSAEIYRSVRTELRSHDLTVRKSSDGQIHVRCDHPEEIECEAGPETLTIRARDLKGGRVDPGMMKDSNGEYSLKGILSYLGKTLGSAAVSFATSGCCIELELPEHMFPELSLNSMSGDIRMEGCSARVLLIKSTSGDIEIHADHAGTAGEINAGTMSGDITLHGDASRIGLNSMSGDVKAFGDYSRVGVKSTSGDAELNGCAQEVWMQSVSGDVTVTLGNIDAKVIEAKTTSGDVQIDLPRATPAVHAEIRSVSGSTRCAFPDAGSGAALRITASTVSGDVRIR